MQPLAGGPKLRAYHERLLGSHDFTVKVDVLTLNEVPRGRASFLDGQVNVVTGDLVRRNATLTLSDPDGALDFSSDSAWEGASLWADRLVRVTHTVTVPGFGEISAVPFIGPPTSIARQGSEITVECSDKGALANRGAAARTAPKGTLAVTAIRNIMRECTGEFRFRLPKLKRRLSKPYSVGLTDEASPLAVCSQIARAELNMQLIYSCDGYLTLRRLPDLSAPVIDLGLVTEEPSVSTNFSGAVNYVRVSGDSRSKEKGRRTTTTQPVATVRLGPKASMSPERLRRKGVERLLPVVIDDSALKTRNDVKRRAADELRHQGTLENSVGVSTLPVFHLDCDDVVRVRNSDGQTRTVRVGTASLPLGVGGDMTIGFAKQVSAGPRRRPRAKLTRSVKIAKKRPKKRGKK